jgi:Mn-containing catalase
MAYIDNPYANSLRQAQAMPAVQQALGGYEGGMDGLMRLFQQQYSRPQQQTQYL